MTTEIGIVFIAKTQEQAATYEQGIIKTMPEGADARNLQRKEPIYTKIIVVPEVTPQTRSYLSWLMTLSHVRRITCICSECLAMFGTEQEHQCLPECYCPCCGSKYQPMHHEEVLCKLCSTTGMTIHTLFAEI